VLAFPQPPVREGAPITPLLGDIIVSLPTAAREAHAGQQPLEDRVLYLLVHGLLHLLGYDHERSATDRRRMEACERRLLAHLAASPASHGTPLRRGRGREAHGIQMGRADHNA
jgi:probable rRNA maturation factor